MTQFHYDPNRTNNPFALPDGEVFEVKNGREPGGWAVGLEDGFYYHTCLPGCLPDSDPFGPYESEDEAIEAAREDAGFAVTPVPKV